MEIKKYDLDEKIVWLENVKIMGGSYKNFSGRKSEYNRLGFRTFCLIIDNPEFAEQLRNDGWNVKIRAPKEEGELPVQYLQVKLSFTNDESNTSGNVFKDPAVKRVCDGTITDLNCNTTAQLDDDEILYVDVRLRPSYWSVRGSTGYTGYVKELYAIVEESLGSKYAQ